MEENRLIEKLQIILKQDLEEIDVDFEKMHERVFFDLKKKTTKSRNNFEFW